MENYKSAGYQGNKRDGASSSNRGSFRNGGEKGGFKGGFRGGWKGGAGGSDRGNGDSRPHTMHPAICSSCQKPCEVPFRPTGDKPVYCRDCFAGRAALGGERSGRKDVRSDVRSDFRNEIRTENRPVNSSGSDEMKRQIDSMNIKLDKLVNTINNLVNAISDKGEEKVEKKAVIVSPTKIEEKMIAKVTVKGSAKKVSKKK